MAQGGLAGVLLSMGGQAAARKKKKKHPCVANSDGSENQAQPRASTGLTGSRTVALVPQQGHRGNNCRANEADRGDGNSFGG
mmetsp:Transcript_48190/g.95817  ORF Transcript_48190/g.95817 Transcript_48190/m.95817 type:complete len:82 (-) Transcript_48190:232-477(-)